MISTALDKLTLLCLNCGGRWGDRFHIERLVAHSSWRTVVVSSEEESFRRCPYPAYCVDTVFYRWPVQFDCDVGDFHNRAPPLG